MIMEKMNRNFDYDSPILDPDLIPKPGLCLICSKNLDPNEELNLI